MAAKINVVFLTSKGENCARSGGDKCLFSWKSSCLALGKKLTNSDEKGKKNYC